MAQPGHRKYVPDRPRHRAQYTGRGNKQRRRRRRHRPRRVRRSWASWRTWRSGWHEALRITVPALQQAKTGDAVSYGDDPQVRSILDSVTPDNVEGYATALTGIMNTARCRQDGRGTSPTSTNTMGNRDANTSMISDRACTGIYGSGSGQREREPGSQHLGPDAIAARASTAYAGAPGIQLPERPLPPTLREAGAGGR